jgi:digeranylgeranylglycerophospholipid reductase
MSSETYDVIVVGGGIAGCFAAATAASKGADVVQLERKSRERGGHIACGDAMKSPNKPKMYPGPIDMGAIEDDADALIDWNIDQIEWWDEAVDVRKVIPYDGHSNVIDRYVFGQRLLEQTADFGVDQHFDTVVNDVTQNGRVTGVEAIRKGEPVRYEGQVLIDGAGAQSLMQDLIAFDELDTGGETTFEMPHYTHFGSAYREIIETEEPVDYQNAIVGKPLEEMGYIWYFPRTPTTINVGLGFQMTKGPIPLNDRLRQDMESRPEFDDANIAEIFGEKDKLGSSIALRRPLDSMVAPCYLAAGGAAGMTHPISGKGIRGAAISGYSAGKTAAEAVADGDVSEYGLWEHNRYIFDHDEGPKLASRDAFNVAASSINPAILRAVAAMLPEEEIKTIVGTETDIETLKGKALVGLGIAKNLVSEYRRGTFEELGITKGELYEAVKGVRKTQGFVEEYDEHYENYPDDRARFEDWLSRRNRIDERFYDTLELTGDERKY